MSRTASPEPIRRPQLEIRLPELHEMQQQVFTDPSRFKVVVCGRQWGKTVLGAIMCVSEAARGGDAWWVAPSFPIGELGWRIVDELCRQIPGTHFEGRPANRITLPTGGTIQLRSADNPDSLRGATLNGVVFDEAAQAKPEAWPTLEPTLAIRSGWAMFISTPKGLNWFHDLYQDAQALPGWATWRFPSATSPYLKPQALERTKLRHSALWYAQEYEAEFISSSAGSFHSDWIRHYYTRWEGEERVFMLGDEPIRASECQWVHTVDLAWTTTERSDYTVISTWAVTPKKHLILADVVRGRFESPDIVPKLHAVRQRWGGNLVIEQATKAISIIQEAERSGLSPKVVKAEKDKSSRAQAAAYRMERGLIWFPPASTSWWPDLEQELLAFPNAKHDDFVDTLSYAVASLTGFSGYETHGLRSI